MALYTRIKGPVGYTTIGSPTMTDGIATGFSSRNYYKLDTPFLPGNNAWGIVIRAKFNNLTARHTLISYAASNTKSVQLTTTVNGTLVTYLSSNGTSANIAQAKESTLTVQANTWYYFRIRFTKTAYEISVSEDERAWTTYITVNSSTPVWQGTYFSIGYNFSQYPEPMDGYIDFNNSYIQIEDVAFWGYSISRVKIRTNPFVKYTVVGSPTITDGVMSDISKDNYAYTLTNSTMYQSIISFETAIKFTTGSSAPTGNLFGWQNGHGGAYINNSHRIRCVAIDFSAKKYRDYLTSFSALQANKTYYFKYEFRNNQGYCSLKEEGGEWQTEEIETGVNNFNQPSNYQYLYGVSYPVGGYLKGGASIDFNETYIKVNGQYWFNGAMQNVETWRPHIKDN